RIEISGARLNEIAIDADARVVHQNVDLAKGVERRLNRLTRGLFLTHIPSDDHAAPPRLSHLAGKCLKTVATPGDDRYIRAFLPEAACDRQTNARTGARDNRYCAIQFAHLHEPPSHTSYRCNTSDT